MASSSASVCGLLTNFCQFLGREIGHIAREVFGVKPRDELETMFDILKAIEEKGAGLTPHQLLSSARLNEEDMGQYLKNLKNQKYITAEGKGMKLTNKGKNFLKNFGVMEDFIENFGL